MTRFKKLRSTFYFLLSPPRSVGAERGLSLVEMIVSLALFTVVILVGIGVLASVGDASKKAQAQRIVIDNLNLAIENISRNLRVGRNYYCFSGEPDEGGMQFTDASQNCFVGNTGDGINGKGNGIAFTRVRGEERRRFAFWHEGDAIKRAEFSQSIWQDEHPITSQNIAVSKLSFEVQGTGDSDGIQPMAFMITRGSVQTPRGEDNFNIQTTITRREYDTE